MGHSILYLMFLFLYLTELTILLNMEFLALIFLIVYIGAVCILMLFHIKLIKTFIHRYDKTHHKQMFLPFLIICIFMSINKLEINYNNNYTAWIDLYESFYVKSTHILGFLIYNIHFVSLILASFILLVAMIGSIF